MCTGKPNCNCKFAKSEMKPEALIVQMPILIKAHLEKGGRRIITFEASSASKDYEGDVIEQGALLNSADYFIKNGFLDVDHYCELGRNPEYSWLGIKNPESWIVGKPLDVYDLGNYRTGVKAEIKSGPVHDPLVNKYDWLWQQLHNEQGEWKASVFGYPGADTEEGGCTIGTDGHVCATRFLVKSFRWHSTALTRNPINKSLKHSVQIVTAKSFAKIMNPKMGHIDVKPIGPIARSEAQFTRTAIRKAFTNHIAVNCPETDSGKDICVDTLTKHFLKCENLSYFLADMYALATSELILRR
jgi:hypothetical protein